MLEDKLCQFGFTKNEAKVYLELLKLGPQAVSVISARLKFSRSTTYSILVSLGKKAVVSPYLNGKITYFSANDPNSLVGYIDQKCRSYDYFRSQLLTLIPKFRCIAGECSEFNKPVVSYFEGKEGVKNVMCDTFKTSEAVRAFFPLNLWLESDMNDLLFDFIKLKMLEKINMKCIMPDTTQVKAFFKSVNSENHKLPDILFVSDNSHCNLLRNQMNIYGDKVAIINLLKGMEYGVVIKSERISEMHKNIFDITWKELKR